MQVDDAVPLTSKKAAPIVNSVSQGTVCPVLQSYEFAKEQQLWFFGWLTSIGRKGLALKGLHLLLRISVGAVVQPICPWVSAVHQPEESMHSWINGLTPGQLAEEQAKGPDLAPVLKWMQDGAKPGHDEATSQSPAGFTLTSCPFREEFFTRGSPGLGAFLPICSCWFLGGCTEKS